LKVILDDKRAEEEEEFCDIAAGNHTKKPSLIDTSFEGHGTLIVAKGTMYDHNPLCLGLGERGNKVWSIDVLFIKSSHDFFSLIYI
jgi:hypothetical protein